MNRYTFVIQIHPDGLSTLENLTTHERIRVSDLGAVGPQIERWLDSLGSEQSDGGSSSALISPEPEPRSDRQSGPAS